MDGYAMAQAIEQERDYVNKIDANPSTFLSANPTERQKTSWA